MKSKLVASQQPDIDKAKIPGGNQAAPERYSRPMPKRHSFSGGNWLNVSENKDQKIVASFMRDSGNKHLARHHQRRHRNKTALFNSAAEEYGMLQQGGEVEFDAAAAADCRLCPFSPMPTTSKSRMSSLTTSMWAMPQSFSKRAQKSASISTSMANPLASRSTVRRWMLLVSPTVPSPMKAIWHAAFTAALRKRRSQRRRSAPRPCGCR